MDAGLIFLDFEEGDIHFPPTYKFKKGTDKYDPSSKQRKPAWCDRILWLVHDDAFENATLGVKQLYYTSVPEYKDSDHRPVVSLFSMKLLKNPPPLPVIFQPMDDWSAAHDGEFSYRVTPELETSNWDWIGLYRKNFKHYTDYITYIWAQSKGEAMPDGSLLYSDTFRNFYLRGQAGSYCLCYFNRAKNTVVGISDTFLIELVRFEDDLDW